MKLVIVDRDGTVCVEREGYIQTPDEWEALPGALDAIARLNQAGWPPTCPSGAVACSIRRR